MISIKAPEGAASGSEPRGSNPSLWVKNNPIPALTIAGLTVYGLLRLSAGLFYSRLGFAPEEVGLGYAQLLARSVYALALLSLVVCVLWYAFVFFMKYPFALIGAEVPKLFGGGSLALTRVLVGAYIVFVLGAVYSVVIAASQARDAHAGYSVEPSFLTFAWSAQAAEVTLSGAMLRRLRDAFSI